ncbi:HypC/HybG/HupF family hydrogenase formation chaperone [Granulosicoccaceae sp. 1_MG-2023]|nr:HypC/HybG/HupF family hydrogenase formation chaperone [Granulosicoccaceae sp. 1_MG-2023]
MCLGIPMQVIDSDGFNARCRNGDDIETVDTCLVGPADAGQWLLVHLGAARQLLSETEAHNIRNALNAVSAVMNGEHAIDHLFADLIDREPQLPPHLQPGTQSEH